jgi:hypothetical protein
MDRSGFFNPAAAKISITLSDTTASDNNCPIAESMFSLAEYSLPSCVSVFFAMVDFNNWKKPKSSFIDKASGCGTDNANALDNSITDL